MKAAIWVMRTVVVLEGLWFALVLFLFNFKLPTGLVLLLGTWVMLIVSLFLFASKKRLAALSLSYFAVIAGALILGFGGSGSSHFFESLNRDALNVAFLIAAHYAYKGSRKGPSAPTMEGRSAAVHEKSCK